MDKGKAQVNIRRLAVQALLQINRDGAYANIVLQQMLTEHKLSDIDRRFSRNLYTVLYDAAIIWMLSLRLWQNGRFVSYRLLL